MSEQSFQFTYWVGGLMVERPYGTLWLPREAKHSLVKQSIHSLAAK